MEKGTYQNIMSLSREKVIWRWEVALEPINFL